jgi:hypothetical protein
MMNERLGHGRVGFKSTSPSGFMKSDWKERFEQAERPFHQLKGLTKKILASEWTPKYRELANLIHTLGRKCFASILMITGNSPMAMSSVGCSVT